jgi:hypothetical protein
MSGLLMAAVMLDESASNGGKEPMTAGLQIGDVWVPGRVLIAPMTGITDLPFRVLASRLGAAYVATEMVACAELARAGLTWCAAPRWARACP